MSDYYEERERVEAQEAMSQGEYMRAAVNQHAAAYGAEDRDSAWILSPFDTWEPNPFYVGPAQPHPEQDQ